MRKVVYRPKAIDQINAIADYTIAEWGKVQARVYIEGIGRQIALIAEYPGVGSEAAGLPAEYRKSRSGSHRVIYRYNEDIVVVVQIIHEREDVPDEIDDA